MICLFSENIFCCIKLMPCHRNLLVHKTFPFPQTFQQLGHEISFRDKCVHHIYSLKFNLQASLD